MAKEEKVLTNKEKEMFKKAALLELNEDIKADLVESVVTDVKKELDKVVKDVEENIDIEFKDNLKTKIADEITDDITEQIKADEARMMKRKNWKIFRKDLVIILLTVCLLFMLYLLYIDGDTTKVKNKIKSWLGYSTTTAVVNKEEEKDNELVIKKYAFLMDNIKIGDFSILNKTNNIDKVDMNVKIAMAYLLLDESAISVDGVLYQVSSDDLEATYKTIFKDSYRPMNFSIDNIDYVYSSRTNMYVAIVSNYEKSFRVTNNITNVTEDNNLITVTCSAYLSLGDEVYSIDNLAESGIDITLKQISYVFEKVENNYYLTRIII